MNIIFILINILIVSGFFLPAYAADFSQNVKNTEPKIIEKTTRIMFGMKLGDATEILGDGCKPQVDINYEPKGSANYIKCKTLKLEFLHNSLYKITYQSGFDLKKSLTPFHEDNYNLPADVQNKLRWGMGLQEFHKVLDLWAKILENSGIKIVSRSDNYNENLNHPLKKNEFSIGKYKKECWVVFGPKSEVAPVERVQWIFSFDQKYNGLKEINVLDREKQGLVYIKVKE